MLTNKVAAFIALVCITGLTVNCKRCKVQEPLKKCVAPQIWKYNTCVYDSTTGAMFNGQWVSFGSTNVANVPNIFITTGFNCNDWRDSLWIGNGPFDSTMNTLAIYQLPHVSYQPSFGRDCFAANVSYYSAGMQKDTFAVSYCVLTYPTGVGSSKPCALEGTINKKQDSIWLRIYNVKVNPFTKLNYCDKIMIKVK
jgi:hypothetical protein